MSEQQKQPKDGQAQEDGSPPKQSSKEVGNLKSGDYMVHVLIQQARQLSAKESESTVNPMVEVGVFSKTKLTSVKNKIGGSGGCFWGQHLFFEKNGVKASQADKEKIKIRVLNKSTFRRGTIGAYEFDLTYIYFNDNHCVQHMWLALTDVEGDDFQKITGYLKVSISVIGTGDQQVELKEEEGVEKTDSAMLMMPPQIRTQKYQLIFRFAKGQHLPKLDGFMGTCDGFVKIEFLSQKIKTSWKKQEDNELWWHQELHLPAMAPVVASRIILKVFDHDSADSDDLIGSIICNFNHINGKENGMIVWKNIYGAPTGVSGKNTDIMNKNPELASAWKGRVLLQYECAKSDEAYLKKVSTSADKQIAQPSKRRYTLKAEFRQGLCLPKEGHKFTIKLKIAEYEFQTKKPRVVRGDLNTWNEGFYQTLELPYFSIQEVDRVYIYLMDDDTPVCYRRFDVNQINDKNPKFRWLGLINDKAIGDVDQHFKAGIIQMRLYLGEMSPNDQKELKSWPSRMRSDDDVHRVLLNVFQCRDLPAADDNGVSDPYLKIHNFGGAKDFKTEIVEDCVNPIYYETKDTLVQFNDVSLAPPLVIDIYDYDTFSSDDFIGRALAYYHEFQYSTDPEDAGKPRWIKVTPGMEYSQPLGQILVGVMILDAEAEYNVNYINTIMRPETTKMDVEVNILGLRGLQSTGILPIKKPFIKFNLNALVPPTEGGSLQNILTQPSDVGKNANINTVIKFKIKLPIDPLYCPSLTCAVYDYIFKGLAQPLLGTFNIPIGEIMKHQQVTITERLIHLDQTIEEVKLKLDRARVLPPSQIQHVSDQDQEDEEDGLSEPLIGKEAISSQIKAIKPRTSEIKPLLQSEDQEESARGGHLLASRGDESIVEEIKSDLQPEGEQELKIDDISRGVVRAGKQLVKKASKIDVKEFKKEKKYLGKFILYPQYQFDEKLKFQREVNQPPAKLFFPLGYDAQKGDKNRHYRRSYETQLEEVQDCLGSTPFDVFQIHRGRSRNIANQDFQTMGAQAQSIPVVGKFKGLIKVGAPNLMLGLQTMRKKKINSLIDMMEEMYALKYGKGSDIDFEDLEHIQNKKKLKKLVVDSQLEHLELVKFLSIQDHYSTMSKKLLVPNKCVLRVYVIEAFGLPAKDNGSDSDPYLILKLGGKKINDRDNHFEDTPHPQWFKHFDFETSMPGAALLNIQVWDHNSIFSDQFIGETIVDVQDRFFSPRWNSLPHKPIELRSLFTPTSTVQQGQLRLWVEILPANLPPHKLEPRNIQLRPASQFQIRLCVFSTKDVKTFDVEGTSDIYIRAFLDAEEPQETDVHYRCQTGKGSFNWRMLFDCKFPRKRYYLNLQIWDKDFFSGNDYIADAAIDFGRLAQDVFESGKGLSLDRRYYNKYMKPQEGDDPIRWDSNENFWIPCNSKDPNTGELKKQGSMLVRLDIIEKSKAQKNSTGKGRNEPNHSPYLPPPTGRISWSLNPFKMLNQFVGPEVRRKVYMACCCLCCVMLCALVLPMVFSDMISQLILKIF